jgi:5-formyltetrahydrofolate cyclo-ligase
MPDFAGEGEMSRSTKVALRHRMITFRASLPDSERLAAATATQSHLRHLLSTTTAAPSPHLSGDAGSITVASYVPVGSEPGGPDLPEMLAAALPPTARLLLPVLLDDGDLDWARYEGPPSLRPSPRGLREPVGPRLGPDAIREATLVIVPALAVDALGRRLGRGGGSYDRALARAATAFTVALLHDGELVDEVPAENHDQSVQAAITPRNGLTLSAGPEWTK